MASSSLRVILIVAGILAVGIGGTLYFVLVVQPRRERDTAQAQVREWEVKWDKARNCLLGPHPLASNLGDAIAARELLAGTTYAAMGNCNDLVSHMVRPPANDSGIRAVEQAWPDVQAAITKVAESYAAHIESPLEPGTLAASLDELVAAQTTLRAAAKMPPPPPIDAPAAAVLAPVGLTTAAGAVSDFGGVTIGGVLRGRASSGGKVFDVTWDDHGWKAVPGFPGVQSLPGHKWTLALVPVDEEISTIVADPPHAVLGRGPRGTEALIALGDDDRRIGLYTLGDALQIGRSIDGGKTWEVVPAPVSGEIGWAATPTGDRLDMAWTSRGELALLSLSPATLAHGPLPAPTKLPAQALATWCTGGVLWIVGATATGYQVWRSGEGAGVPLKMSQPKPVACNTEAVVLRSNGDDPAPVDQVCTATACTALPTAGEAERFVGLVGTHVFRADTRGNVIALWRDNDPPRFLHLPEPRDLYGIADVGGKPVLLLLDSNNLALEQAPVP